jgi:hypothetical protein
VSEPQELRPNAGKPYTYTWMWSGEDPNRMVCALDPSGNQKLSAFFWELQEPTLLHDETLAQATITSPFDDPEAIAEAFGLKRD